MDSIRISVSPKFTPHDMNRVVPSSPAPGYKERILFPMDLSLVRKMIVSRMIKSFSSLHQRVALICHNCVKFNGRYVLLFISFRLAGLCECCDLVQKIAILTPSFLSG